jgi:hypothetical protein
MENCNKIQSPVVTATLAAGSAASPYYVLANITQKLCYKTCADTAPVFDAKFTLLGYSQVGTSQYVANINVHGIICYVRCGGGCDCTEQQPLSANFTVPFYSATAPSSVTLAQGAVFNTMSASGCQMCSRLFVSECPLTLTVS